MASRHPKMQIVAWHGTVKMHQAAWGDETGSTVTFKLPMKDKEDMRNPFEKFTKRRKGKAGTRFFMGCQTCEPEPQKVYEDEVMLAGWNDSQTNGHTVKFWLCNDKMGHPFEWVGRQRELMIALAELMDDNEPVDQKMRDRVEQGHKKPSQRLSYVAVMLCKQEEFWDWASQSDIILGNPTVVDEGTAVAFMYGALGIRSRAELDENKQCAVLFESTIRKPYITWHEENFALDPPF